MKRIFYICAFTFLFLMFGSTSIFAEEGSQDTTPTTEEVVQDEEADQQEPVEQEVEDDAVAEEPVEEETTEPSTEEVTDDAEAKTEAEAEDNLVFTLFGANEDVYESLRNNKGANDVAVNVDTSTYYTDLRNALSSATAGQTVLLLKDLIYTASTSFSMNGIILDLDGHTITDGTTLGFQSNVYFGLSGDGVKIMNGTFKGKAQSLINISEGANATLESLVFQDSDTNNSGANVITINSGSTLNIEDVTINNFYLPAENNNVIYNQGTLIANKLIVNGSQDDLRSQVIYSAPGSVLTLNNSKISNLTSGNSYGLIYLHDATSTIKNSEFSNNTFTNKYGRGPIYVSRGTLTLENTTISGNKANYGGGIYSSEATIYVNGNSSISNNTSSYGGGIYGENNSTIYVNDNSRISNNTSSYGGGICSNGSTINVDGNSVISGNYATYGGGIYTWNSSTINVSGSQINNNTSYYGGGIYVSGSTLNVKDNSSISNNTGHYYGGGIYSYGSTINIVDNGHIDNNNTLYHGGGIYSYNSNINMTGGTVNNNTAGNYGGGIYVVSSDITSLQENSFVMTGGSISGNTAGSNAGGLYLSDGTQGIIKAGVLKNNIAYGNNDTWGNVQGYVGAAVYVNGGKNSRNAELYLTNVLITDNTATGNKIFGGGGIAGCPTSWNQILSLSGGLIYGNKVNDILSDIFVLDSLDNGKDDVISLAQLLLLSRYSLGNLPYNWKDLLGNKIDVTNLDELDVSYLQLVSSITSEQAKKIIEELGLVKVFITGNQVIASDDAYLAGAAIGLNGSVFIGTGKVDPVSIDLDGKKTVDSKEASGSEYTFVLKDKDGNVLQTKTNVDGKITFDPITYLPEDAKPGDVFTYTISEVAGSDASLKYDGTVYTVTVTIGSQSRTVGQDVFEWLTADVVYSKDNEIVEKATFNNLHKVTWTAEGTKILSGDTLKDGQFTFELVDENGNVIQTVTNAADGSIVFDELSFDSVGTYVFTIREKAGNATGMTYDTTEYTIIVTVSEVDGKLVLSVDKDKDDVAFNNTYKPEEPEEPEEDEPEKPGKPEEPTTVQTGEETNFGLWAILSILSLMGILLLNRRQHA